MSSSTWTRTSPRGAPTYAGTYQHASGWRLEHCGHPPVLWPYLLFTPDGAGVVAHNGHGFQRLEDAQLALEGVLAGRLELVKPSADEYLRAMEPAQAQELRALRAVYPDGRLPRRRTRRSA